VPPTPLENCEPPLHKHVPRFFSITNAAVWLLSWRTRLVAPGLLACKTAIADAFDATAFACLLAVKSDESKLPVGIVSISAKRKNSPRIKRAMEYKASYIWFYIIAIIVVIVIAYYIVPGVVLFFIKNKVMDEFLTKLTVYTVLMFLSVYGIMWYVKSRAREGFVDADPVSQWKTAVQNSELDNVCSVYSQVYENKVKTEKGTPPNEITEEQARERVDADFKEKCTLGVFSCSLYKKLKASSTLDAIYADLPSVPDSFLAQAYQTLIACKTILEKTVKEIEDSISKIKVEGFDSPPICSEEAAKARQSVIKKSDPANDPARCVLAEEITPEIKSAGITRKLQTVQAALEGIQGKGKPFKELYKECMDLKAKLDELKAKAESGTLAS
jgi:hypothetical protein